MSRLLTWRWLLFLAVAVTVVFWVLRGTAVRARAYTTPAPGASSRWQSPDVATGKRAHLDAGYLLASRSGTATSALRLLRSDERIGQPGKRYFAALLAETCRDLADSPSRQPRSAPRDFPYAHRGEASDAAFCAGMPTVDAGELKDLWQAAAQAGDPRAIALVAWQREFNEGPLTPQPGAATRAASTLSDARTQRLLDAIATRDPTAIIYFGSVLMQTTDAHYLQLVDPGAAGEPQPSIAISALPAGSWALVACDYGLDCSGGGRTVSALCERDSNCGAADLDAHLRGMTWSDHEAALFDRSRAALRAIIETGSARGLRVASFADAPGAPHHDLALAPLRLAR